MNTRRLLRPALIAVLLSSAAFAQEQIVPDGPGINFAAPIVELFEPADNVPAAQMVPTGFTVVQGIRLRNDLLSRLAPGKQFTITPEPGVVISCIVSEIRGSADRNRVVVGLAGQDSAGHVHFSTHEDATAMLLDVPALKLRYRLQFAGGGLYQVWKIDESQFPPEECPGHGVVPELPRVLEPDDDDYIPPEAMEPDFGERVGGGCTAGTPILDHMVVYTAAARDAMGGTSAIRAEAALAVELMNTACANSAISTRARLVYCNLITYTEGVDQDEDLDRLRGTSDGYMDSVHSTRDTVNADMVILYNNQGSGLGYCPGGTPSYAGSPFCTAAWWRAAATYTHAHEVGHNLGCGHNTADGGACGPAYGVGWRWTGNDSNGYCSVMAYGTSFYSRVLHYSNPSVTYQGVATGVTIGLANQAHNTRVITDNDNTVEGFELTRYDIYVDIGSSPLVEIGTYAFPYNTLIEGVNAIDVPNTGAAEPPTLYLRNSTTVNLTISKEMTIVPCGGAVTIGNP